MSEIDLDCCEPGTTTNPKTRSELRRRSKRQDHLFRLKNPIPEEVKDNETLKKIFKNWNLIPYAGTNADSSHSLLAWYLMLAKLSPTNSAAINKKIKFAVGGKARVQRSVDPEFETGEELKPVSTSEAVDFINAVKQFFEFEGGISKCHGRIGWQYEATGNSFVEMSFASVMGQSRISIKPFRTTHCMFVNTAPGEAKAVAISPVWTDKYLEKHPPRVVPMYPIFSNEDGVLKTMFHLKNGDNHWYGRPPSEGADIYKYREIQDAIYQVRASASNFTGQLILEVEDDDPQYTPAVEEKDSEKAGYDGFVDRFEQNFTNKGDDPQSAVVVSRPYGSRPMFVFQVSPNTKQDWYKVTGEISESKILRAHQITPRFLGFDVANGFATDVYIADYMLNVEPVITELHDEIMTFTNAILTVGWNLVGQPDRNIFSLAFAPPIQGSIDEFKTKAKEPQSQPAQPQNPNTNPNPNQPPANPNQDPGNSENPPN